MEGYEEWEQTQEAMSLRLVEFVAELTGRDDTRLIKAAIDATGPFEADPLAHAAAALVTLRRTSAVQVIDLVDDGAKA